MDLFRSRIGVAPRKYMSSAFPSQNAGTVILKSLSIPTVSPAPILISSRHNP